MNNLDTINAASLLMTRFSHDVTGPISAINQGVELLEEDGDMREEALGLIIDSAKQASARLQFYRLAYGQAPNSGEASLYKKRSIIDDFMAPLKIRVDWEQAQAGSMSHTELRVAINLLIMSAESILRGGELILKDDSQAGAPNFRIEVTAHTLKLDAALLAALNAVEPPVAAEPKQIQHWYALSLLREQGGSVLAEQAGENAWSVHYCI
jgi:histidine phosphotransferase ChpT